jgi:hypothetical protein
MEKKNKTYKEVTERFCANLNDNAIIVRTVDAKGEALSCLSSALCENCENCKHHKKQ